MKTKVAKFWGLIALLLFTAAAGISAVAKLPEQPPKKEVPIVVEPPCVWYAEAQVEYVRPKVLAMPHMSNAL